MSQAQFATVLLYTALAFTAVIYYFLFAAVSEKYLVRIRGPRCHIQ